jgi:uncharacterized protein (DUF362 family)
MASHSQSIGTDERIQTDIVRGMIDETLPALTGAGSIRDAWLSLFPGLQSSDVIGIKVNCINRSQSSHPEVVYALAESLVESLEVNPNNILIWDRTSRELKRAKYTLNRDGSGIRCLATSDGIGYDEDAAIDVGGDTRVRLSAILSQMCDYLINVPVLKDHSIAGVTLSLKNHYGSIDRPGACHRSACDPYIGKLNSAAQIREKTALVLCDALFGIYQGGPGGKPQWMNRQILASTDPVALDYTGMTILDAKRREKSLSSLATQARHLETAARLQLGSNDPQQMELVTLKAG